MTLVAPYSEDLLELPTVTLRKAAQKIFKETQPLRRVKMMTLRKRLGAAGLLEEKVNDMVAVSALRGENFIIDAAVATLEKRQAFREKYADWFTPFSPAEMKEATEMLSLMEIEILENTDKFGRAVLVIRQGKLIQACRDRKEGVSIMKLCLWLIDRICEDIWVQVYGVVIVSCFSGLEKIDSVKTLPNMLPLHDIKLLVDYLTSCCSLRLEGVYVFDQPLYLDVVWNAVSNFVPQKARDQFHFCGSKYRAAQSFLNEIDIPDYLDGKRQHRKCWLVDYVSTDTYAHAASQIALEREMMASSSGENQGKVLNLTPKKIDGSTAAVASTMSSRDWKKGSQTLTLNEFTSSVLGMLYPTEPGLGKDQDEEKLSTYDRTSSFPPKSLFGGKIFSKMPTTAPPGRTRSNSLSSAADLKSVARVSLVEFSVFENDDNDEKCGDEEAIIRGGRGGEDGNMSASMRKNLSVSPGSVMSFPPTAAVQKPKPEEAESLTPLYTSLITTSTIKTKPTAKANGVKSCKCVVS